jgi:spore maturation protein CgeB
MIPAEPAVQSATPIRDGSTLSDIVAVVDGKKRHVWGRKGPEREAALLDELEDGDLPVLLGAGLGLNLNTLLSQNRPVALVDMEAPLLEAAGVHPSQDSPLFIPEGNTAAEIIAALRNWAGEHGGSLKPVILPFHKRLRGGFYTALGAELDQSPPADFWEAVRYPKFQNEKPRILFFETDYFLNREIIRTLDRLEIPSRTVNTPKGGRGSDAFIKELLSATVEFKPDFALTVNHFGLDRDGRLMELLERLNLPLASWFVDNPYLILYRYPRLSSDRVTLFSYDEDSLEQMRGLGYKNVHWLPLGTDETLFAPDGGQCRKEWAADVSFVGNSMQGKISGFLEAARVPGPLLEDWQRLALAFGESGHPSPSSFLRETRPELAALLDGVVDMASAQAYESLLTFEATRRYRQECIRQTLPFHPHIAGDEGWTQVLPEYGWQRVSQLDYYDDLPGFYRCAKVNLNCTSLQMKGAVNQRVFDVPACGGFLLTDSRRQLESLFDPGTECATYACPEELPAMLEEFLSAPDKRRSMAAAARKRILARHTYRHRITELASVMRRTFS